VSIKTKTKAQKERRIRRVRSKVVRTGVPRVSVFRSLNHIYAQLIDDVTHRTLASCSTIELKDVSGHKKDKAKVVGTELAKRILAQGIERIVFDRGSYLFHGRVKALADGLKEGGIKV
jgi:large subunit ribosomal protein L18